jgi:hypothetical protein
MGACVRSLLMREDFWLLCAWAPALSTAGPDPREIRVLVGNRTPDPAGTDEETRSRNPDCALRARASCVGPCLVSCVRYWYLKHRSLTNGCIMADNPLGRYRTSWLRPLNKCVLSHNDSSPVGCVTIMCHHRCLPMLKAPGSTATMTLSNHCDACQPRHVPLLRLRTCTDVEAGIGRGTGTSRAHRLHEHAVEAL